MLPSFPLQLNLARDLLRASSAYRSIELIKAAAGNIAFLIDKVNRNTLYYAKP